MSARILSVDDNEVNRYIRRKILAGAGYDVEEAVNGADALQQFRSNQPDLVLLDMNLPDMSGIEICRRIRVLESGTPVAVLQISATHVGTREKTEGLESGADGYLTEPVDGGLLLATVRSLLRMRDAERNARLREQQLRFALTAGRMGIWSWNAVTNEVTWSQELYDLVGVQRGSGTSMERISRELIHPADADRVANIFVEAMQKHQAFECEYRVIRPNGTLLWIASRGLTSYGPGGEPISHTAISIDITERRIAEQALRKSEDRFQRLWNANVVGITATDSEKVIEANDVFLRMLGYSRDDLALHELRFARITAPEYRARHDEAIQELLTRGSCTPYEKEYLRKDHTRVSALVGIILLQREPLRCMYFVVDLTERKALEKKLFEKQNLEKIGLLAGGVAHDFNNLLVAILGNASLAEDMLPEDSPVRGTVQEIQKASERAAHLTRQMLAYSGKGRFIIEPLNFAKVVRETVEIVMPSIPKKIHVDLELDEEMSPIEADIGQIQQIVMNLVLNASEAIGEKPGQIAIRTSVQELSPDYLQSFLSSSEAEPGLYALLEVTDTGPGIDEHTKQRIFEPFFTTKFMGRGLGLAAVDGIVRGHKGAIQVGSVLDRGTTFTVFLPLPKVAPIVVEKAAVPGALQAQDETILLVDDEPLVLRTAQLSLQRYGYKVLLAPSGHAALDILREQADQISLVILDLSMPGMSGLETLTELRTLQPELRVFISSGYSESESLQLFAGHEVSGFIQKPYTSRGLVAKLQQRSSSGTNRTSLN